MTPKNNPSPYQKPNEQSPKAKGTVARWIVGVCFGLFALVNGFHFSSLFLLCAAFLMLPLPFVKSFLKEKNIKTAVAISVSVVLFFVGVLTSPPSDSTDSPSNDTEQTTQTDTKSENNPSTETNDFITESESEAIETKSETAETESETAETESETVETESETEETESETEETESETAETESEMAEPETETPETESEAAETESQPKETEKAKMVWVPSSGSKYHSRSTCSGMVSPRQIPLEDAIKQGYTACKKCH